MSNRRAHGPGIRAIRESLGIPHGKFAVAIGISPGYLTNGPGIRAIRESLGIPHGKFAVAIGISPGYLTNVEKGVKVPSDAVVAKMAHRLGVTIDQITYPLIAA